MAETPVSQEVIYRARPTLRFAGEEDIRASELILSMRMEENEGGMSTLELRLSNLASTTDGGAELAFGADSKLKLGAALEVYAGDEAQPREIFRGNVTAIEADFRIGSPPELTVLAEDALARARMARRSKTYSDMAPADVTRAIASDLGLRPVIAGLDSPTGTWAQINESDLAFLRRLLARFDADVQVVGEELHVSPRGDVRRGGIELALYSQLARARVIADLADQVTSSTARGWNAADGAAVDGTATSGTHLGPGQGREGAAVLREALDERAEHVGHLAVATRDEAQAVAEAAYDLRARRFVTVEATAEGNAQLRVGAHVTLSELNAQFDNTYYVVRACHLFDVHQGYRTDFRAECAFLGG
jgi:Bacteriophage probable baseplate hub protein